MFNNMKQEGNVYAIRCCDLEGIKKKAAYFTHVNNSDTGLKSNSFLFPYIISFYSTLCKNDCTNAVALQTN